MCSSGICPCNLLNAEGPILVGSLLGFIMHSTFLLYQKREHVLKFMAIALPLTIGSLAVFWVMVYPSLHLWGVYVNVSVLIVASVIGAVLFGSLCSMAALKVFWRK